MSAPVIGITLDREEPGGYSKFPWLALRENYGRAVSKAGGLPVLLPHETERVDAYLALIQHIPDEVEGALAHEQPNPRDEPGHRVRIIDGTRLHHIVQVGEMQVNSAHHQAACGGQQLLHVVLGGTLIQHIPDEVTGALAHEQPNPRDEPGHRVRIIDGTLLRRIVQVGEMPVNSAHHQAAKEVPIGVAIGAVADDGVIEAIEARKYRFCIGVQWHPEFEISEGDSRLFAAFVDAAR